MHIQGNSPKGAYFQVAKNYVVDESQASSQSSVGWHWNSKEIQQIRHRLEPNSIVQFKDIALTNGRILELFKTVNPERLKKPQVEHFATVFFDLTAHFQKNKKEEFEKAFKIHFGFKPTFQEDNLLLCPYRKISSPTFSKPILTNIAQFCDLEDTLHFLQAGTQFRACGPKVFVGKEREISAIASNTLHNLLTQRQMPKTSTFLESLSQNPVMKHFLSAGNSVKSKLFGNKAPPKEPTLDDIFQDFPKDRVTYLSQLTGIHVTPELLQSLNRTFPNVHTLDLSGSHLQQGCFETLSSFQNLKRLQLDNCEGIQNFNFEKLPQNLEVLYVNSTLITNASMEQIGKLSRLQELSIQDCRLVTGETFDKLPESLLTLNIIGIRRINNALLHLNHLHQLRTLKVSDGMYFEFLALIWLPIPLPVIPFESLPKSIQNLTISCNLSFDRSITNLNSLPSLKKFTIISSQTEGTHFDELPPTLEEFDCRETGITDQTIPKLSHLTNLKVLHIPGKKLIGSTLLSLPMNIEVLHRGSPLTELTIPPPVAPPGILGHIPLKIMRIYNIEVKTEPSTTTFSLLDLGLERLKAERPQLQIVKH